MVFSFVLAVLNGFKIIVKTFVIMKTALCTEVLYPLYGVERRVYEMARRLPKHGFGADVFTSTAAEHFPRLSVKQVSPPTIMAPPKRDYAACLKFMSGLFRELTQRRFDIIDANGHMSLLPCSLAASKTNTPVVATIHDLYFKDWGKMYKGRAAVFGLPFEVISAKMKYDRIIALNSSIRHKLVHTLRIPGEKIEVIPSGIDTKELDRTKSRKKQNEILFAGRLVPQKNVDLLIKAFSHIKDAKLTIIGDGTEKENLIALATKLDLKARIKFISPVSRTHLIRSLRAATVFVMPSKRENFGIVPLEAMYCGTATVSTNTEGPRDYIKSGENGMLVEIGNEKRLYRSISLILSDNVFRKRLEKRGRRTAKEFDWERIIGRIADMYKETL